MIPQERFLDIVIYLIFVTAITFFFVRCDKDINGNGIVRVSAKNCGKATNKIKVTIKSATFSDNDVINADGETWFNNLTPDNYSIRVELYDNSKINIIRDTSAKVVLRYRLNEYKIKVDFNQ